MTKKWKIIWSMVLLVVVIALIVVPEIMRAQMQAQFNANGKHHPWFRYRQRHDHHQNHI